MVVWGELTAVASSFTIEYKIAWVKELLSRCTGVTHHNNRAGLADLLMVLESLELQLNIDHSLVD